MASLPSRMAAFPHPLVHCSRASSSRTRQRSSAAPIATSSRKLARACACASSKRPSSSAIMPSVARATAGCGSPGAAAQASRAAVSPAWAAAGSAVQRRSAADRCSASTVELPGPDEAAASTTACSNRRRAPRASPRASASPALALKSRTSATGLPRVQRRAVRIRRSASSWSPSEAWKSAALASTRTKASRSTPGRRIAAACRYRADAAPSWPVRSRTIARLQAIRAHSAPSVPRSNSSYSADAQPYWLVLQYALARLNCAARRSAGAAEQASAWRKLRTALCGRSSADCAMPRFRRASGRSPGSRLPCACISRTASAKADAASA